MLSVIPVKNNHLNLLKMTENAPSKGLSSKLGEKRKRQADDANKQPKAETAPTTGDGLSKRQRKLKKQKKAPEQDARSQDRKNGVDESIGRMDGRLLADYFVQRAQKLDKELSAVELNDLSIPGNAHSYNHNRIGVLMVHRLLFPRHDRLRRHPISRKTPNIPQGVQSKRNRSIKSAGAKGHTPYFGDIVCGAKSR